MVLTRCERCGKEELGIEKMIKIQFLKINNHRTVCDSTPLKNLCDDCKKELDLWMESGNKNET